MGPASCGGACLEPKSGSLSEGVDTPRGRSRQWYGSDGARVQGPELRLPSRGPIDHAGSSSKTKATTCIGRPAASWARVTDSRCGTRAVVSAKAHGRWGLTRLGGGRLDCHPSSFLCSSSALRFHLVGGIRYRAQAAVREVGGCRSLTMCLWVSALVWRKLSGA